MEAERPQVLPQFLLLLAELGPYKVFTMQPESLARTARWPSHQSPHFLAHLLVQQECQGMLLPMVLPHPVWLLLWVEGAVGVFPLFSTRRERAEHQLSVAQAAMATRLAQVRQERNQVVVAAQALHKAAQAAMAASRFRSSEDY